jgi:hypothetical protein
MNFRQRAYDSYDRSNYNLKITNSYYHFKNIQKIIYRKPEYQTNRKIRSPPRLKINTQPFNNYFVMRENELYKKIINGIRDTKVKPKINNYYKLKEEKMKEYRKHNKTLQSRQLSIENINYKKRLRSQKSMLKIREMDKDYKNNHLKMVERSRKIKDLRSIVLPPINTIVNRIRSPKGLKYNGNYEYSSSYRSSISKDAESLHQEKKQPHETKVEK